MINIRKSKDRGVANFGWLDSKHTFSFANYYNPTQMGFGALRVINEDKILGGAGFDTHGHKNMEIVSYVIEGALAHKDSTGVSSVIWPGDIQRMTAGTGVEHSEYNHEKTSTSHFLQIWIHPKVKDLPPSYEQKSFSEKLSTGELILVASKDGRDDSVTVQQDVDIYALKSSLKGKIEKVVGKESKVWIQVIRGALSINNLTLESGDGASIEGISDLHLNWSAPVELLMFEFV
ncbi:MAG: pirin family protein [Proteobacteria bacterium]|nr:pirin family protein [Pseudomonadota bacterium]